MSEIFSQNYEDINNEEGIIKEDIPSFNDLENNITQNYENNSTREGAQNIALNQYKEQQQLRDKIESPILQETREQLDKEAMINEAKTMLYEKLGIDENQDNNNILENFIKGVIDGGILDNYDLAIQVWETNGKIILDGLEQLASWEGLKQIAKSIGEDIWSLLTGNAYEKGKVSAEIVLILLTSGAGLAVNTTRKGIKLGIKEISKLKLNKERLVKNLDVKEVIGSVNNKVSEIIPKQQLDFEKAVIEDIAKLSDKDRINAGKFYLQKDITPGQQQAIIKAHNVGKDRDGAGIYNYNQGEILEKSRILKDAGFSKEERKILLEKGVCGKEFIKNRLDLKDFDKLSINEKLESLGIPKEFYDLLNNSKLGGEGFDVIKRYRALQYRDILLGKEYIDFNSMIDKVIKKIPNLDRTEAMLIFASTDKFLFQNINGILRGGEKLTKMQKKLLQKFDDGLDKMPDLDGKHIIRGDNHHSWISKNEIKRNGNLLNNVEIKELISEGDNIGFIKGDNILLDAYTFVSNNKDDIFIGKDFPKNDTLIIIKGANGIVKDISGLSMYKNFGEKLLEKNTDFEGIIKRGTSLEFIDSRIIKNAKFNEGEFIKKILIVRVKK